MVGVRVERRNAANVAGYSWLMGEDEEGRLAAVSAHRTELIEPSIT